MLLSSARPVCELIVYPTGCCIQEFAAIMKPAESVAPMATIQMQARWIFFGKRSQPKTQRPRKVDSRKNASQALHSERAAEDVTHKP